MENIFEDYGEDSDQENFQNIDIIEGIDFPVFPIIKPEIGAGDCRPTIAETTRIRYERVEELPTNNSIFIKSRWFYLVIFLSFLLFLFRLEAYFDLEDGQNEVPFLQQMIRCNERRYELIHSLNIIHTALKRCTLEDSKKDEAGNMLSQLHSLYERHIVDLEKFTEKIPTNCKNTGKTKAHS